MTTLALVLLVTLAVAALLLHAGARHARERAIVLTRDLPGGDPLQALLLAPGRADRRALLRAWRAMPPPARRRSALLFWWMLVGTIPG